MRLVWVVRAGRIGAERGRTASGVRRTKRRKEGWVGRVIQVPNLRRRRRRIDDGLSMLIAGRGGKEGSGDKAGRKGRRRKLNDRDGPRAVMIVSYSTGPTDLRVNKQIYEHQRKPFSPPRLLLLFGTD
jgi:hypothetical protein